MKRLSLTVISFLSVAGLYAQDENPFAKHGYQVKVVTMTNGRFPESHDRQKVVQIGSVYFDTKDKTITGDVEMDTTVLWLEPQTISRWMCPDPMAEKYYHISPYAYCSNNPINRIDPDGLTDFTLNKRTGELTQVGKLNDDPDRILKTYEFGKNKGEIKYKKDGEAKVAIDNVENGILLDGMNFKNNDYMFEVGGVGQPSVEGVESFALQMSDYVGREIGGAYFAKDGAESTTHMTIGKYKNNTFTKTEGYGHGLWNRSFYPDSKIENNVTGFFHTHPTGNFSPSSRTSASPQDLKSKANDLKLVPTLQFFILTRPVYYGGPYKFPY